VALSPADVTQNSVVAGMLREYGDILRQQGAESFRAAAYDRAADVVERLDRPLGEVFRTGGREALMGLPAVGRSIAAALAEMLTTGRWAQLERLRGTLEPEERFMTIPGVGPELAKRIADELHVDTLEQLEAATHDGRLAATKGSGRGGRR
jgi:DNA polymerase (family X)